LARPPKAGLTYFPKDVDFYNDYKIMDLLEKYGPVGAAIYDVLLCEVFRNGYYLEIPLDKLALNIVRILGSKWVQKSLVLQVILDCGDIGLFETTLLSHGVITSVGIQRRYSTVTVRNKVQKEKYWLIDDNGQPLINAPISAIPVTDHGVSVTEMPVNSAEIQQKESKENKSKEKESKSKKIYSPDGPLDDAIRSFVEYRGKIKKPMTDHAVELLVKRLSELAGEDNPMKIRILNESIINGWQGIFPLKDNTRGHKPNSNTDYDAMLRGWANEER